MKYSNFFKMLEKKDHLIKKLPNLTDTQKEEAIAFFTKHPNYEKEIDWNRKDLDWEDFEEVIYKERVSKSQLKNFIKKDKHFLILHSDENCILFQPLTWLGSRYLASKDVAPGVIGTWCISYQKDRVYWDRYSIEESISFIILCTKTTKYALEIHPSGKVIFWNQLDVRFDSKSDFIEEIISEVPNIRELLDKYVSIAIKNHPLVEERHNQDLTESETLDNLAREAEELRINNLKKKFRKNFNKSVSRYGYYLWDNDFTDKDLQELDLFDKENGTFKEELSKFRITGNFILDTRSSLRDSSNLPNYVGGSFALKRCRYLTDITIPQGVKSIETKGFYGCTSLKRVYIPESVTSIGDYTFYFCSALEEIYIPNSVTSLGERIFYYCDNLKKVHLPENIESIKDFTFIGCSSLEEISIPNSVKIIKKGAFSKCNSLESVIIPNSVESIEHSAFKECYSLNKIKLPNKLTVLEDLLFSECRSLETIELPSGLKTLGNSTFKDCTKLRDISLPDGLLSIGPDCFERCYSLKEIYIPKSVNSVYETAFLFCDELKNIYIDKEKNTLSVYSQLVNSECKVHWKGEF